MKGTSYRKGNVVVLSQGRFLNDLTLGEIDSVIIDSSLSI